MRRGRNNALLLELLVVVLYFVLLAAVLIQIFAAGYSQSQMADAMGEALSEGQELEEQLYKADEPERLLEQLGYARAGEIWSRDDGSYMLQVELGWSDTECGRLLSGTIEAIYDETRLFELPFARYVPGVAMKGGVR